MTKPAGWFGILAGLNTTLTPFPLFIAFYSSVLAKAQMAALRLARMRRS